MALMDLNNRADPQLRAVNTLLYRFGEKLMAPEEFKIEGRRLGHNVFLTLQKHSKKFSVAAVRFGGSFGKNTDVLEPDLDLIIVLNALEVTQQMWNEALEEFNQIILRNMVELQVQSEPRRGKRSLNFSFKNGIEVDLLPAANIRPDEVYTALQLNPEKFYEYNTSLVSRQLDFLRSHQSSFVHIIIRLVKFWLKSLNFGEKKMQGGSTIMELIGIAAAEEEETIYGTKKSSAIRTLLRIFEMIIKIDSIKLAFQEITTNKWIRVPEETLKAGGPQLIPHVVGTRNILNKKCFIIESVNPFYDLLGNVDAHVIAKLKEFAQQYKHRITKLLTATNVGAVDILELYKPQPMNLASLFPSYLPPDEVYVVHWYPYESPFCSMEVRNDEIMKKKETRVVVEQLKWNLLAAINTIMQTYQGEYDEKVHTLKEAVEDMIQTNLNTTLVPPGRKPREPADVTLIIPYNNNGYGVKLSINWLELNGNKSWSPCLIL